MRQELGANNEGAWIYCSAQKKIRISINIMFSLTVTAFCMTWVSELRRFVKSPVLEGLRYFSDLVIFSPLPAIIKKGDFLTDNRIE